MIYGVFDGHGGKQTAESLQKVLPTKIGEILSIIDVFDETDIRESLTELFHSFDTSLYTMSKRNMDISGSTAIVAIKIDITGHPTRVYLINLGDSRGILFDHMGKILLETKDHKPDLTEERQRIIAAGGFVSNSRVDGCLAISRAFGDFDYKVDSTEYNCISGKVIATPDIYLYEKVSANPVYGVLASDGLWDHYRSEEVSSSIIKMMKKDCRVECSYLVNNAIKFGPSGDNVTALFFCV